MIYTCYAMTIIDCDYMFLSYSTGFPMIAESPFDLLAVQPNPSTPTPANGSFSVTSKGYVYHQKKNILICQLIHHDPCFTMIFQGVLLRSVRMDPLPSYIHNLTNWTNLCVCVSQKKGSPCKNAQKYRTLLNIIYNIILL